MSLADTSCDPIKARRVDANPDCAIAAFGDVPSPYCNSRTRLCTPVQCTHSMHCDSGMACVGRLCVEMRRPKAMVRTPTLSFENARVPHLIATVIIAAIILIGVILLFRHGLPF